MNKKNLYDNAVNALSRLGNIPEFKGPYDANGKCNHCTLDKDECKCTHECPICMDVEISIVLGCLHGYCDTCIQKYKAIQQENKAEYKCPTCAAPIVNTVYLNHRTFTHMPIVTQQLNPNQNHQTHTLMRSMTQYVTNQVNSRFIPPRGEVIITHRVLDTIKNVMPSVMPTVIEGNDEYKEPVTVTVFRDSNDLTRKLLEIKTGGSLDKMSGDIIIALDKSGSQSRRLGTILDLLELFVKGLPKGVRVGLLTFNDKAYQNFPLTEMTDKPKKDLCNILKCGRITAEGYTSYNDAFTGMKLILDEAELSSYERSKTILFITDGKPTVINKDYIPNEPTTNSNSNIITQDFSFTKNELFTKYPNITFGIMSVGSAIEPDDVVKIQRTDADRLFHYNGNSSNTGFVDELINSLVPGATKGINFKCVIRKLPNSKIHAGGLFYNTNDTSFILNIPILSENTEYKIVLNNTGEVTDWQYDDVTADRVLVNGIVQIVDATYETKALCEERIISSEVANIFSSYTIEIDEKIRIIKEYKTKYEGTVGTHVRLIDELIIALENQNDNNARLTAGASISRGTSTRTVSRHY